ncbi:polysaccharide biosynthesis protein [Carnobacterium funditum]|uniref:polysaccharide biosynthesis protein n=1 Tax=Carnobacterium funditum TaxID=2752 RepID=UPI00068C655F|nr:nucleoside-diphosphate sugar epimerase/dehydratase [Carnobacterium funditum]
MSRNIKKLILISYDSIAICLAAFLAYQFLNPYITLPRATYILSVGMSIFSYLLIASYFKIFNHINRYLSIREVFMIVTGINLAFLSVAIISLVRFSSMSLRFLILTAIFSTVGIIGIRILWRTYHEYQCKQLKRKRKKNQIRTLIVGAGEGGNIFIRGLKQNFNEIKIIGVVDDDPFKHKTRLYDIPILGSINDIPELVKALQIEQITIAIPSLKPQKYEQILDSCNNLSIKVNLMPSIEDVLQGKLSVTQFKEVDVVDLLGRKEVQLNMQQILSELTNKTILISGAGGSIGSEICRQIAQFSPKRLILLGHGENSIYQIDRELTNLYHKKIDIIPVIADVQDRKCIFETMQKYQPDRVYHAAAHKHVPMMEYNPKEAIKNNIFGTKNMADAAKATGVTSFVMISTDKAVNPPNIMGATKRIAEMIVTGLNEPGKTKFAAVRFGNVLGSRGSVVPLFKEQIKKGGPITITDFRMTRYFMTIPEASRLVIQAGALAKGGEVFILDMGEPVKILDLAKNMVRLSGYTENEIKILESGIRPGEKLYEELLVADEQTEEKVHDKIFVGKVKNMPTTEVMDFIYGLEDCKPNELKEHLLEFTNNKITKNIKADRIGEFADELLEGELSNV